MATDSQRCIQKKIKVLNHSKVSRNVSKTCRHFGISRETFYQWKKAFENYGEEGLIDKKPGFRPGTCPWRTNKDTEEKSYIYVKPTISVHKESHGT